MDYETRERAKRNFKKLLRGELKIGRERKIAYVVWLLLALLVFYQHMELQEKRKTSLETGVTCYAVETAKPYGSPIMIDGEIILGGVYK